MPPKKQQTVMTEDSSDEEQQQPLEDQVEQAVKKSRKKGVAAHVDHGKEVQKAGVAARRQNGFASAREKSLATARKKNDRLERMQKIEEAEAEEKARSERLSKGKHDNEDVPTDHAPNYNGLLSRLEELLQQRQGETQPKKGKRTAKKPPGTPQDSSDESDEPPRQKQVRKSAKKELRNKTGAMEEDLNNKGHLVGNKGKQRVMQHDADERWRNMASNLFPGGGW